MLGTCRSSNYDSTVVNSVDKTKLSFKALTTIFFRNSVPCVSHKNVAVFTKKWETFT